nr:uncharacterized protein LOC107392050 isoform X3 [Nothobranchius furzeri]
MGLGFHFFSAQMEKANHYKRTLLLIILITCVFIIFHLRSPRSNGFIPKRRGPRYVCKPLITEQTITPLKNTKHLLVSAFMDQRVKGFDVRIIGMFLRDSIQPLYCLFCCSGHLNGTKPAMVLPHTDHFGFPFGATDVMCQLPKNCDVSHVTLLTRPSTRDVSDLSWIPVKNKKTRGKDELTENFTVCISTLFGKYNNVLQFAQSLEMYRLLGVNRVVIYNNSCGPDLEHLLQSYVQEGFVEMVPWPIDKHMNPSHGWQRSQSEGDIHYFGQLTTLNECIYRSMDRSRYVLLNDIDEIIMPYMHNNLMSLMDRLQPLHPDQPPTPHPSCVISRTSTESNPLTRLALLNGSLRLVCSLLKTTSFPRSILTLVGNFICLSGEGCQELIFWSTFTGKTLTETYTIHTR